MLANRGGTAFQSLVAGLHTPDRGWWLETASLNAYLYTHLDYERSPIAKSSHTQAFKEGTKKGCEPSAGMRLAEKALRTGGTYACAWWL